MRRIHAAKTALIAAAVLWLQSGITAQPMMKENARAMPYFSVGFNYLPEMTDFTDDLKKKGIGEFSEYAPSFGLGHTISSRWVVIEKEFGFIPWTDNEAGELESEFGMGYARGAIGLNVLPPDRLIMLYPAFGVGLRVSHFSVHKGEADFDTVLLPDEPLGIDLWKASFIVDGGLMIGLSVPSRKYTDKRKVLGLKLGVTYNPFDNNFFSKEGVEITNAPETPRMRVYANAVFGIDRPARGMRRHKMMKE